MDKMHATLKAFLNQIEYNYRYEDELIEVLGSIVEVKEHPAGYELLRTGQYCKYVFIVQDGMARRYTLEDGKDITLQFAFENEMITSFYSTITHNPSIEYIETIEDSTILYLSTEKLEKLYEEHKEILMVGKLLRDNYFLTLEKRILSLQVSSAQERYINLLEKQAQIIQRAALSQVASYLGMAQETLSRLRRKI